MRGSKRVDSVGMQLMPNGLLTGYKRKRKKRRKGGISRGEDEVLPNRFGASLSVLALCFLLHRFSVAGFRGGSRCFEDRPCTSGSTSDPFSCFLRRSEQRSASVRRLFAIRSLLLIVIILCPIEGCNTLLIYLLVDLSTYSSFVSSRVVVFPRSLRCKGRDPV